MPRTVRPDAAGCIYHAINRGNNRQEIFHKADDYLAFRRHPNEYSHPRFRFSSPFLLRQWVSVVNKPQSETELTAIRHSVKRGTPYGSSDWFTQSVARIQLQPTLRPRGWTKKQ
jgi:hypothetical protein